MTVASAAPFDVVIIGDAVGLPEGMAATSRLRLYARALASVGANVQIMLTTVSERPPNILNRETGGLVDGMPYEYTTGTPIRGEGFMERRVAEARGTMAAIVRLAAMRRNGRRVAILAYMGTSRSSMRYLVLTAGARVLCIPVVLELCEAPWPLQRNRKPCERLLSPLAFTSGAITISSLLTGWANAEYRSRRSAAIATKVPILVDTDEVHPDSSVHPAETALYASSSGYDDSLAFVLEAMRHVWVSEPGCRLVVTGIEPEELDRCLRAEAFQTAEAAMVIGVGRVDRDSLLKLYAQASVCLAPLFQDRRSRARFPTKLAEYAAAGRPIVTSSVGEVRRYFEDRGTAFIAEPGDATGFGRKILEALSDPQFAATVGAQARELAETHFDYRVHASSLYKALARALSRGRQPSVREVGLIEAGPRTPISPAISIVLPTYNRATLLPRAVDSVLRQTLSDWELIIVDDGSTDETPQVLAGFEDSRISVCRHERNRGVTAAKNTGLDRIRGGWFTLLDSDDEMETDALTAMLECAERMGANAITCNCVDAVTGELSGIGPTRDGWLTARDAARCSGEHWGLTQTALLGDLRFDERLPGFESTLWLKINRVAHRYYIHRALRIYHTEGTDRVTVAGRQAGVMEMARHWLVVGEDRAYLAALRRADPMGYGRAMLRVWAARCMRPALSLSRSEVSQHE